jgi:hypothetical protein
MNDRFEIYCDDCGAENYLLFEESLQNTSIQCGNCGSRIYWYHCADCECGYSSNQNTKPCPECMPEIQLKQNGSMTESPNLLQKLFCVECPVCGKYLFGLAALSSEGSVCIWCSHCRSALDSKGEWKFVLALFSSLLLLAAFAEKPIHNFLVSLKIYIAYGFCFAIYFIYICLLIPRFVRLEKYLQKK